MNPLQALHAAGQSVWILFEHGDPDACAVKPR